MGIRKSGIQRYRLVERSERSAQVLFILDSLARATSQEQVQRLGIQGSTRCAGFLRTPQQPDFQCAGDREGDLGLQCNDVLEFTIEVFRPDVVAGDGIDQLGRHPHASLRLANTAFKDRTHVEFSADRGYVDIGAFEGEGRSPRGNLELDDLGQRLQQLFREAVGEVLVFGIAAHVGKREHRNRMRRRVKRRGGLLSGSGAPALVVPECPADQQQQRNSSGEPHGPRAMLFAFNCAARTAFAWQPRFGRLLQPFPSRPPALHVQFRQCRPAVGGLFAQIPVECRRRAAASIERAGTLRVPGHPFRACRRSQWVRGKARRAPCPGAAESRDSTPAGSSLLFAHWYAQKPLEETARTRGSACESAHPRRHLRARHPCRTRPRCPPLEGLRRYARLLAHPGKRKRGRPHPWRWIVQASAAGRV